MDKILTVGRKSHHSLLSKQLFIARTSDTRSPTFDSENAANQFLTTPSPFTRNFFFYSQGGGGGRSLEIPSLVFDNEDCTEEGTPKDAWRFIVSTPSCSTEKKIINEKKLKNSHTTMRSCLWKSFGYRQVTVLSLREGRGWAGTP